MVLAMSAITFVTADAPFTDSGNTAWVLAAAALVLFMTPGLALFYGGMVRTKSVLNMMMMSLHHHGHGRHGVDPLGLQRDVRPRRRRRPRRQPLRRTSG